MSSDWKHTRRRTNSVALGRGQFKQIAEPKSSHTADDFLQPFLGPSFDAAQFLNSNLPPLQQRSTSGADGPAPLAELSAQAQALVSQLNAHTTRLSGTLTQLTDDILRSGSRLAYEVELLRGETLGLTETMNEKLQEDIQKFVPGGVRMDAEDVARESRGGAHGDRGSGDAADKEDDDQQPPCVKQLQTLTLVRARLESVIKTFGDAMEFTFPPSELSVSSSFLSVSAPEPGSDKQSSEERGQQVLKQLRTEISSLLTGSDDAITGIERAARRVEELKDLTSVWKGTAEEKGRNKFIESLAKMVEDKHRELMREMEQAAKRDGKVEASRSRKSSVSSRDAPPTEESKLPGGFGLINQLQRLRSGL